MCVLLIILLGSSSHLQRDLWGDSLLVHDNLIYILELDQESIPIFWQMTDMVIEYTLEPFWVLDLYPRSQESPLKSGRVPDFVKKKYYIF